MTNEKELLLEFEYFIDEIILLSDYQRIKQILKNLLSNAIKFTKKGKVSIVVVENTNDITIKIIDEGIGIAADKLNHIFERFKQADGSTTRKYGGTGLGLAISKELAILLGADIKASSFLEKGSTFELILPKKTNIKNISDDKVTISLKDENTIIEDIILFDMENFNIEEKKEIKEKNILLINSDYEFFFPFAVSLKKENMKISYFKSIEEFYEKTDQEYDLVVLDDKNMEENIDDFINYCKNKEIKLSILSFEKIENEIYIDKTLKKTELLNKILEKVEQ